MWIEFISMKIFWGQQVQYEDDQSGKVSSDAGVGAHNLWEDIIDGGLQLKNRLNILVRQVGIYTSLSCMSQTVIGYISCMNHVVVELKLS